jgi:hypothetical protein
VSQQAQKPEPPTPTCSPPNTSAQQQRTCAHAPLVLAAAGCEGFFPGRACSTAAPPPSTSLSGSSISSTSASSAAPGPGVPRAPSGACARVAASSWTPRRRPGCCLRRGLATTGLAPPPDRVTLPDPAGAAAGEGAGTAAAAAAAAATDPASAPAAAAPASAACAAAPAAAGAGWRCRLRSSRGGSAAGGAAAAAAAAAASAGGCAAAACSQGCRPARDRRGRSHSQCGSVIPCHSGRRRWFVGADQLYRDGCPPSSPACPPGGSCSSGAERLQGQGACWAHLLRVPFLLSVQPLVLLGLRTGWGARRGGGGRWRQAGCTAVRTAIGDCEPSVLEMGGALQARCWRTKPGRAWAGLSLACTSRRSLPASTLAGRKARAHRSCTTHLLALLGRASAPGLRRRPSGHCGCCLLGRTAAPLPFRLRLLLVGEGAGGAGTGPLWCCSPRHRLGEQLKALACQLRGANGKGGGGTAQQVTRVHAAPMRI